MKKILFYSDCFIFGGCELVISNILQYEKILKQYKIYFAYRYSHEYEKMLKQHLIPKIIIFHPICIFTLDSYFYRLHNCLINPSLIERGCYKILYLIQKIGLFSMLNFWVLLFLFKKIKPDILHINNGGYPAASSCLIAVFSAKLAGIKKIVFTVNNLAQKQRNILEIIVDKCILSNVNIFTTASKAAAERLAHNRHFDNIINIPNTVRHNYNISNYNLLREEYHIDKSTKIIGSAGILTYRKGFHILIDAIKMLVDEGERNFKLIIFGEGEDRKKLENQIDIIGLNEIILLPGFKNNILEYVNGFDIFILPSIDNEDFPYVILEAMSLQKPIIGTNVAGIPEQIVDGETGFVVEPHNANALKEKISYLLNSGSLILEMGLKSKKRFQDHFIYDSVIDQYDDLYSQLLIEDGKLF